MLRTQIRKSYNALWLNLNTSTIRRIRNRRHANWLLESWFIFCKSKTNLRIMSSTKKAFWALRHNINNNKWNKNTILGSFACSHIHYFYFVSKTRFEIVCRDSLKPRRKKMPVKTKEWRALCNCAHKAGLENIFFFLISRSDFTM